MKTESCFLKVGFPKGLKCFKRPPVLIQRLAKS